MNLSDQFFKSLGVGFFAVSLFLKLFGQKIESLFGDRIKKQTDKRQNKKCTRNHRCDIFDRVLCLL